jgi:hypothetical protein
LRTKQQRCQSNLNESEVRVAPRLKLGHVGDTVRLVFVSNTAPHKISDIGDTAVQRNVEDGKTACKKSRETLLSGNEKTKLE